MEMQRDFQAELKALEHELVSGVRWQAVNGLCALEEDWARHLLGVGEGAIDAVVRHRLYSSLSAEVAEQAALHLDAAERWLWETGSSVTGAGEGLALMARVYVLKMAQAWLAAARTKITGDPQYAARAEVLVSQVEKDPNRLGAAHADDIAELRGWISTLR